MRPLLLAALALCALEARASTVFDFVPRDAAHCALAAPPADAGIAVTPGGFVIVHYFENGQLRRLVAQDARSGAIRGACAFPLGNSLLPGAPRDSADPACAGVRDEPFYGLHLPTWPRACATQPDRAVCRADPT